GSHTFEVRASLNGRDWSNPLSMQIYKAPPPWQTWWAYFGYLLIISSVIGYFLRIQYQKAQEKMRSQKLIRDSEERLKLALWGSRDELWDWNLISGKIHRSNTWGLLSFPKRDTDEHGSNALFRNIHPKDLPSVRAALDDHKNGYTSHYEATYRVRDKEGQWIWILDRGKIVEHDSEGKPLRMSGTIRNISDIRDTQEQLDLIAKAFENTSDGVFILDNHFKYQAVNKAYEKITGFKFSDKKDKLFDIHSTHTSAKDVLHKVRQSLVLEGAWQGELEDTRASGELYTIELKLDAVRDRLDEITHFVGVFSDITYRKKAEQDLRRMANYDQLTGLPNRSLFQDRLKHAIALSDRNSKELILLFIDLDNFKIVNDSLGHSIGDRLLTKVAERISACVRSNDTVARLGGDEYTILLEQVEGSLVGTRVADKILDALSRPFRIQGHELVIGCSIGIAMYPDDGADVETLLRNADTAMYSAKYQTKNTYQFFTDSMNKKANSRLEMEHELRKAIPAGDIKVVYQPKVDLTTGRIVGCEALARWQHPELGFVSPEDFISLAEETGLIYSLGESVLNNACAATAEWKKHHGYSGRTAVNLSAIQFRQTGLLDSIESIVNKHGLSGSDLELELTEGMLVTNPDSVNQIMSDFRAKDYHLSIDDFGTGYASMAQLKNFPINTLKIDKTFIDDLTNNEQDASLVKAVLSLAQNLNLSTVAEGVEYQEQVEALSAMGCESIQGYVYSKPISTDLFAALLESNLTLNEVIKRNNEKIINFPA
ncbi:MAG: EAL domain-containing protein, partial [Gammaproteobacteria bacterium]